MADLEAIVKDHMQKLQDGDVDGVLADYSDQCTLRAMGSEHTGTDAIRGFFDGAVKQMGDSQFDLAEITQEGDNCVVIAWNVQPKGGGESTMSGGDKFVFEGDKIVEQDVWFGPRPS